MNLMKNILLLITNNRLIILCRLIINLIFISIFLTITDFISYN
jgi:hypothetical protein